MPVLRPKNGENVRISQGITKPSSLVANKVTHGGVNMPGNKFYTIGEVATELGVPRWRLAYLIERGTVTGPTASVPGRKLFSEDDIQNIRRELALQDEGGVAWAP